MNVHSLLLFAMIGCPVILALSQDTERPGLSVASCASFASDVASLRGSPLGDIERADLIRIVQQESEGSTGGVMSRRYASSCILLSADCNKSSATVLRNIVSSKREIAPSARALALSGLIWIEGDGALDDAALVANHHGSAGVYGRYHLQRLTFEESSPLQDDAALYQRICAAVLTAKRVANSWDDRMWHYASLEYPEIPMLTDTDKWRAMPLLFSRAEIPHKKNHLLSQELRLSRRHLIAMHVCDLVVRIVPDDTRSALGGFPLGYPDKSFSSLFLSVDNTTPVGHQFLHYILQTAAENGRIVGRCEAWIK